MALNKQVWLNTIVENFFPDNSFATKSIDDSVFVSNKTVHIPNAGAPSGVVINRTEKPASVNQRTDQDLTYDMDELTTNPIYIPNIDTVELSYDKRQSILWNDRMELQKQAHQNLLYRWFVAGQVIQQVSVHAGIKQDVAALCRNIILIESGHQSQDGCLGHLLTITCGGA